MSTDTGQYMIHYRIDGFEGDQKAGPYKGYAEARKHRTDIQGYEGVRDVRILICPLSYQPNVEIDLPEVPAHLTCSECGFGQYTDRRTGSWFASMGVTNEGVEFQFQCCPQHAQQADGKYDPIELEGFETWTPPKHDLRPDHVVVANQEEVVGSGAALIQGYAYGNDELSSPDPFGLSSVIKEALALHKAHPLEWEQLDETTEHAWDPVTESHLYRPFISATRKAAVRSTAAILTEALREAGEGPKRALEGFLAAVRGDDEPFVAPGLAALEDREVCSRIREGLRDELRALDGEVEKAVEGLHAKALRTFQSMFGNEGRITQLDIDAAEDGFFDIKMDIAVYRSAPTDEISISLHKTEPPTDAEIERFLNSPVLSKVEGVERQNQRAAFLKVDPD